MDLGSATVCHPMEQVLALVEALGLGLAEEQEQVEVLVHRQDLD
jgi:hypothetical protein